MNSAERKHGGRRWLHIPVLMVSIFVLALVGAPPAGAADQQADGSRYPGHTPNFSVLAAKWWQWGLTQPTSTNPLIDSTGQDCAQGQRGNVWFLAGNFNNEPGSPFSRSCTVPNEVDLFFPLVNTFSGYQIGVDPVALNSVAAQRHIVDNTGVNDSTGLSATVDGRPVPYHFEKSIPFSVRLPATDNLFGLSANFVLRPTVDAGYYAYVSALCPGNHTITFTGTTPANAVDVTYHLTVRS